MKIKFRYKGSMDDYAVTQLKSNLRAQPLWPKEYRDQLTAELKDWENRYTAYVTKLKNSNEAVQNACYPILYEGIVEMVELAAVNRDMFAGETGYEDMLKLTEDHIEFLLKAREEIGRYLGISLN